MRVATIAVLALLLALSGAAVGAWALRRVWRTDEVAPRMFLARSQVVSHDRAVELVSAQTGAPRWYVRWASPGPAYSAPCVEVKGNPWRTVNRIGGFVGGAIMSVIPPTAPFGVATLALASGIEAALPPTVVRKCR